MKNIMEIKEDVYTNHYCDFLEGFCQRDTTRTFNNTRVNIQ